MRVTARARLKSCKIEMYSNENTLIRVIDEQQVLDKNPVPKEERFLFDFTADQMLTCKRLFEIGYEKVEKIPMNLPEEFLKTLNEVALKASEHNIPFTPYELILRALYRETERVENRIKKEAGIEFEGVKKFKEIFKIDEKANKLALTVSVRIIQALLEVEGNFYTQFNDIAANFYDKENHSVLKKHLLGYAQGHAEPSNWVLAIALEVLAKNHVNVLDLGIEKDKIVEIWCKANPDRQDKFAEVLGLLDFE